MKPFRDTDVESYVRARRLLDDCVVRLPAFARKVDEYTRGGLPSNSVPEAISGTSDPIMPTSDRVDAALERDRRVVMRILHDQHTGLWSQLQQLDRILNAWLIVAPPVDDPVPCSNLECDNDLEAGRMDGECGRCRAHRSRHNGLAYPKVVA